MLFCNINSYLYSFTCILTHDGKTSFFVFTGCESFQSVLDIFKESRQKLGEVLSAFEFMDSQTMTVAKENLKLRSPIEDYPFYVLIETSGSNGSHDEEKLSQFLEHVMGTGIVQDGTVATEPTKIQVGS